MAMQKLKFYVATILNPQSDTECDFYKEGLLVIETDKKNSRIKDLLPLAVGEKKYQGHMTSKKYREV